MPDVLEAPPAKSPLPECLRPFAFTSETAAKAARKRHEADRNRQAESDRIAQPPKPALIDERLALLDEQIALTRGSLNAVKLAPKDRAQLVRALCGLLDQQRIARGEPLPGSRRPREEGSGRRSRSEAALLIEDAQVVMTPSSSVPVLPAGWEYDDPPGLERAAPTGCGVEATSEPVVSTEPPASL
jgi:hypothetical protein